MFLLPYGIWSLLGFEFHIEEKPAENETVMDNRLAIIAFFVCNDLYNVNHIRYIEVLFMNDPVHNRLYISPIQQENKTRYK